MSRTRAYLICRILLLALFAVNVYRGATQSITTDEAFTYTRSVRVPIPELWKQFDANDHVLHTLLCKVTTKWFGASEFTLRLPSLAAGFVYLIICLRSSLALTTGGWGLLLAYALLVLNPLMLDYCSIARGYGMATTLFLLALEQAVKCLQVPLERWRYYAIGLLLALAVSANLTAVFPGIALVASFAAIHLGRPILDGQWPRFQERLGLLLDRTIVPGAVLSLVLLLVPLLQADRKAFYVGSATLVDAAQSIVYACLWRPLNPLEHTPLNRPVQNAVLWVLPWLPLAILAAALLTVCRRRRAESLTVLAVTTGTVVLLVIVLHAVAGVLYPQRRTGLYLVPLFTLLGIALAQVAPRVVQRGLAAFGLLLVTMFAMEWNVRYYDEWLFDSNHKQMMRYLRERAPTDGRILTVGAAFPFAPSVEYYRDIWKLRWLAPPKDNADGTFDIYVLAEDSRLLIEKHHLTTRLTLPSGVILATSVSSGLRP